MAAEEEVTAEQLREELNEIRQNNQDMLQFNSILVQEVEELRKQAASETPARKKMKDKLRQRFDEHAEGDGLMDINEFMVALGTRGRGGRITKVPKPIAQMYFGVMHAPNKPKDRRHSLDKEEFVNFLTKLNAGTPTERAECFFQLLDADGNGEISADEFTTYVDTSMKAAGMKNTIQETDASKVAEMERSDLEQQWQGVIDTVFEGHPKLNQKQFTDIMTRKHAKMLEELRLGDFRDRPRENGVHAFWSKVWRNIINQRKRIFLFCLIASLTSWAFTYKWQEYDSGAKFDLMGYTLPLAKGCAEIMKVTILFLMIFMCRRFITIWRGSWIGKYLIEFDDAIAIHKICAQVFFAAMWVHVIAHIINVENIVDPANYNDWLAAYPDKGDVQDTRADVYGTDIAITGILLTIGFSTVFFFALEWPRNASCFQGTSFGRFANDFNTFWLTHHIVFICFVLLVCHPLPGWCWDPCEMSDKYHGDTWQWVILPLIIYGLERLHRSWKERDTVRPRVIKAKVKAGNVLQLRMTKPKEWDYGKDRVQAGMYCFIKCEDISGYEWHPFTLTSAPHDNFMECHIRGLGDWTNELIRLFKEAQLAQKTIDEQLQSGNVEEGMRAMGLPTVMWPTMGLEGPFGAPAQNYQDFEVLVLVGAGIGVTPFASILSQINHEMEKLYCPNPNCCTDDGRRVLNDRLFPIKKVYFYFMSRNQGEFSWFKDTLEDLVDKDRAEKQDSELRIECHQYITSVNQEHDVRSAALKMVQSASLNMVKSTGPDPMQQTEEERALLGGSGAEQGTETEMKSVLDSEPHEVVHDRRNNTYAGKDLFTGMKSNVPLHFGSPDWPKIFKNIKKVQQDKEIGVFFCGHPAIGAALNKSCEDFTDDGITYHWETNEITKKKDRKQTGTSFVYHEEHF